MEESSSKIDFIFWGDAIFELRVFLNDGLIFYKQRYLDSILDKGALRLLQHIACNHFFCIKNIRKKIIHN